MISLRHGKAESKALEKKKIYLGHSIELQVETPYHFIRAINERKHPKNGQQRELQQAIVTNCDEKMRGLSRMFSYQLPIFAVTSQLFPVRIYRQSHVVVYH